MPIPTDAPIVVAPMPTPFDADDAVDHAAIESNVKRWLATPLSGFVLNSENGEEAFLSEAERLEIVRTVRRVCGGEKLIIGGIDSPSATDSLRWIEALADAGAELIRVRIPRLTANMNEYFQQLIPRAARPIVIIHQMAPGKFLSSATPIGAPAESIAAWVARDNVLGYITSDNLRFEARVAALLPDGKRFWAPNGSLLLPAAALGANGACLMLGNVLSQACRDIVRLMMEGRLAESQAIHHRIVEADWQILSRGAAGVKAALNLLDFQMGGPRAPSAPCNPDDVAQIRAALRTAGIDC